MSALTIPRHHLLRARDTLASIIGAPHGGLGGGELLAGVAVGDLASVVLHVHVRFSACKSP